MLSARLASVAAFLTLVVAAPASADSIAFIKGGDVWLSTPDGARQQQVTRTGSYSYVSQADDGTMIALAPGERLHRLSRTGAVLADFTTYVSDGGPVSRFQGPFSPEISPDGTKVAFEWFNDSYENAPGCSEATVPPCQVYTQRQGVGISASTGYTGPEAYGLMTGWIFPHWMTNDVLLRSFSGAVFNDDAVITPLGGTVDPWFFDDQQGFGVDDVELSRDLSTVVGIAGQDDEKLRVYRTVTHPFGAPDWNHQPFYTGNQRVAERCYELDGKFESTSLAPGRERHGVWHRRRVCSWRASPQAALPATAARCSPPARASRTGARPTSRPQRTPAPAVPAPAPAAAKLNAARHPHRQGHADRERPRPRVGHLQAQGPPDRLRRQDGQGRRQGHTARQAQAARARQGDREGHLQARRRRRYADCQRVREAAVTAHSSAPVTESVRLIARSPSVSR